MSALASRDASTTNSSERLPATAERTDSTQLLIDRADSTDAMITDTSACVTPICSDFTTRGAGLRKPRATESTGEKNPTYRTRPKQLARRHRFARLVPIRPIAS
jgi:hypothetical protein